MRFNPSRRFGLTSALAALAMAALPGFAVAQAQPAVRVASKIDTEGSLLGQLIIRTCSKPTASRPRTGCNSATTQIVRSALHRRRDRPLPRVHRQRRLLLGRREEPGLEEATTPATQRVKALDLRAPQAGLAAARRRPTTPGPSPCARTWRAAHKLNSLADLGKYLAGGGKFKLAASAEFVERPDALPAFQAAYGFKLRQDQLLDAGRRRHRRHASSAAAEQTSGVNAAMAYGTDGPVAALGLLILDDPKGVQPVYAPAPVIRAEVLARQPKIATLLAPVFATPRRRRRCSG